MWSNKWEKLFYSCHVPVSICCSGYNNVFFLSLSLIYDLFARRRLSDYLIILTHLFSLLWINWIRLCILCHHLHHYELVAYSMLTFHEWTANWQDMNTIFLSSSSAMLFITIAYMNYNFECKHSLSLYYFFYRLGSLKLPNINKTIFIS